MLTNHRVLPSLAFILLLLAIPLIAESRPEQTNISNSGVSAKNMVTQNSTNTAKLRASQAKKDSNKTTRLSQQDKKGLLFMREEEKLARDVYLKLFDQWNVKVFQNIANSEQKHMDAVLKLINKYGLIDPATDVIGEFNDEELSQLYIDLMATGMSDSRNALWTGALIEETDIQDIVELMHATDNEDIINVYANLLCGSRNHLRSFVKRIEAGGAVYSNQIPAVAKEVKDILATEMEKCN